VRWIALALLCTWVLGTHVHDGFETIRLKVVRAPLASQPSLSLPLTGVDQIRQPLVVVVCRLRNNGDAPVVLSANIDRQFVRNISLAPGTSTRVDLVWTPRANPLDDHWLNLSGPGDRWTLDYVEIANLHGYTSGLASLLVLPARQPFPPPPPWSIVACCVWAWLMWRTAPAVLPRWLRYLSFGLSVTVAVLFALIAASDLLSPYRVVLAIPTFVIGLLVLSAPELCRAVILGARKVPAPFVESMAAFPWFRSVLLAGFVGYAILLATHVGAYAGGSDSSSYLNSARLLDSGYATTPIRRSLNIPDEAGPEDSYIPLGFRPAGSHAMVPITPIGLPLMVVGLARGIGWDAAPGWIIVGHALMGVLLTFWLARECALSPGLAALAALLLASSPLYLFSSLQFMSDVPALVWTTMAVVLAWHNRRKSEYLAALAGVALSMAVLIRPANVLALAPLAVCLGTSYRRWLWLIVGGVPGMLLLFWYNQSAYGHPLMTGYGDLSTEFSVSYLLPTLRHYGVWLPVFLTPLCVLALAVPMIVRRNPRLVTMLLAWIATFAGFYAFYSHTHDAWPFLRFILPAFPPLIVVTVWVARVTLEKAGPLLPGGIRRHAWAALAVTAVLVVIHNHEWSRKNSVLQTGNVDRMSYDTAEWTRTHLPSGAAIVAMQLSGSLFYYTHFPVFRYDDFSPEGLRHLESAAAAHGVPLYAALHPFERERLAATLTDHSAGTWRVIAEVGTSTIWRFSGAAAAR
jgi:hypothetical protein